MPGATLENVLRYLRHAADVRVTRDLTDAELLERFRTQRDEAAFTLLVQRHGPMVMGVCRRLLGDLHGAEDAFQATFLVLSCKATAIHMGGSLAAWLHGVAQRVARKARGSALRRREHERRSAVKARAEPVDERTWEELRLVLDEELSLLPEKYRAPVVLCYFQGKTNEQAARELGCPKSSLSWRLGRARELLRERLVRRGITLSTGTLAAVLMEQTATAGLPALLVISTVRTATTFAAGGAAAAAVSAEVATLTKGALKTMFLTKLKIATMAVLVAGLLGGAVLVTHRALAGEGRAGAQSRAAPARENPFFAPAKNAPAGPAWDDQEALQGAWECASAEMEGKALPEDEVKKMRVVIQDDRMVIVPGGEFERLSFKVDAAKDPKVLHVTPTEGKDKGKTTPVIYELDPKTGTLRLCFDTKEGKKLPTEFVAKPGSGLILLTLKHELQSPKAPPEKPDRTTGVSKPQAQESKSPATPEAGAAPTGTEDKKTKEATANAELDGSYTVVEAISTEKKRPGQATTTVGFIRKCRVTIKEGVMSFVQGDPDVDGERADVKFTLDPSKEPGRIDLEPLPPEGSEWVNPSSTLPGIYRVKKTEQGLELTIAWMASSQGERPEKFDGKVPAEVVVRLLRKGK